MRQRARHEQVIGTASSGIEYEMTREWKPTPVYHRHTRRFIKLAAHTTPSPPRPAGRMAERGNGKRGEPLTDEASGTQNPASHHPHASNEQADEADDGTEGNSERAGARERHNKKASRQTAAMPAAANRQQLTPPTPGGGGTSRSKQIGKSRREGVGRKVKGYSHIYI